MYSLQARHLLTCLLILLIAVSDVLAQPPLKPDFLWGFNNSVNGGVPECSQVPIFVKSPNLKLSFPLSITAYEGSGYPTVQNIGEDPDNMTWTVRHSEGSQLIIAVTDAEGRTGGLTTTIITVTAGTTSCHPASQTSPLSLTTNTTNTLNTCDYLPLRVAGGKKPYKLSLVAIGTTFVSNVSLNSYDELDWVNTAHPGSKLMGIASDADGNTSAGTAIITTTGNTDTNCSGRRSTWVDNTGALPASQTETAGIAIVTSSMSASAPSGPAVSKSIIIGVAAVGCMVLIVVAGTVIYLSRKKKFSAKELRVTAFEEAGDITSPDTDITPFVGTPYLDHNRRGYIQNQSIRRESYHPGEVVDFWPQRPQSSPEMQALLSSSPSLNPAPPPHSATSRSSFISQDISSPTELSISPLVELGRPAETAGGGSSNQVAAVNATSIRTQRNSGGKGGMASSPQGVYQHQDITDLEELPPAYKERTP